MKEFEEACGKEKELKRCRSPCFDGCHSVLATIMLLNLWKENKLQSKTLKLLMKFVYRMPIYLCTVKKTFINRCEVNDSCAI